MVNYIDETISALADPTRRRVIEILLTGPHRASEIATGVGVSRPALSRHLRVLRNARMVDVVFSEDDARERIYQLRRDRFLALRAWLDQVESFWKDQLESFQAHANRHGLDDQE